MVSLHGASVALPSARRRNIQSPCIHTLWICGCKLASWANWALGPASKPTALRIPRTPEFVGYKLPATAPERWVLGAHLADVLRLWKQPDFCLE